MPCVLFKNVYKYVNKATHGTSLNSLVRSLYSQLVQFKFVSDSGGTRLHVVHWMVSTVGTESYASLKLCDLFSASIMRF